jgi:hypothetical protein
MKNHLQRLKRIEATAATPTPGGEALRLVSLLTDEELAAAAADCWEAAPQEEHHTRAAANLSEAALAAALLGGRPDLRRIAEARAAPPG